VAVAQAAREPGFLERRRHFVPFLLAAALLLAHAREPNRASAFAAISRSPL